MQFWRQCYTVAWVVVLGVAGQAWAAPAWNAPTTVIGPYIKEQADLMKAAPTAAAATAIRDDIELGLKPPKETGSPPPAWKSEKASTRSFPMNWAAPSMMPIFTVSFRISICWWSMRPTAKKTWLIFGPSLPIFRMSNWPMIPRKPQ